VEKKVDGHTTRYVNDGDHIIAEYVRLGMACANGNNNLLRKYIYGPGIDQPVSMTGHVFFTIFAAKLLKRLCGQDYCLTSDLCL